MVTYRIDGIFGDNPLINGPTIDGSSRIWAYGFIATARDITTDGGTEGNAALDATRTATRCFMRGLRERIFLQQAGSRPIRWRRICFTFSGLEIINPLPQNGGSGNPGSLWYESTAGYHRAMVQLFPSTGDTNVVWQQLLTILFRGENGKDWSDIMMAQVDNRRVVPKYDKVRTIRSGNDEGNMKEMKLWHPMNKTLIYNDEESGGDKLRGVTLSANNRQSMGDYYIIDLFDFGAGSDDTSGLQINCQSGLYWHER